jgi:Tfp pilus assembly protein PilO
MNELIVKFGSLSHIKAGLAGVLIAVLYFFGASDSGDTVLQNIENAQIGLKEAKIEIEKMRKELNDVNEFEIKVKTTTSQFKELLKFMPEDLNIADFNKLVTREVAASGLRAKRIAPTGEKEVKEFYSTIRIQVELEGTFSQIMTFMSNLSRSKQIFTFEGVELSRLSMENSSSNVLFAATIVGYKYVPKDEDKVLDGAPASQAAGTGGVNVPN